jgi:hypothetical protein
MMNLNLGIADLQINVQKEKHNIFPKSFRQTQKWNYIK